MTSPQPAPLDPIRSGWATEAAPHAHQPPPHVHRHRGARSVPADPAPRLAPATADDQATAGRHAATPRALLPTGAAAYVAPDRGRRPPPAARHRRSRASSAPARSLAGLAHRPRRPHPTT